MPAGTRWGQRTRVLVVLAVAATLVSACSGGSSADGHGSALFPTASKSAGPPSAGPPSAEAPSAGSVTAAVPPSVKTVTVSPTASRERTPAAPRPTAPFAGRTTLLRTLQAATPVDPTPYFGAHPNLYFQTPTGNIGCYIFDEDDNSVSCQIANYDFDQPGPDCSLGAVVEIDGNSSPSYAGCASGQLFDESSATLPYGSSLRNGELECVSAYDGVTCADADTGSGFFVSRQRFTPVQ